MDEHEGFFGEHDAELYDRSTGEEFDAGVIEATVDFLAGLAGDGRVLELGVGTGRIALPLAGRGIAVPGIDLSQPMVDQLRAKRGGDAIQITIGDFSTVRVDGSFSLAYLVYNTIENLTTQDAQVACFENVARHLAPGGRFVIECAIPDLRRLPHGETSNVFDLSPSHWGIDEYDVATQGLISHHFTRVGDEIEYSSGPFRYVWPSELDLMARLAGMALRDRWAGWDRAPFTGTSTSHVSVWHLPA